MRDGFGTTNLSVPHSSNNYHSSLNVPLEQSHSLTLLESSASNLFMQLVAGASNVGSSGDNGPATLAQINAKVPWVDSLGTVYIPEYNGRIRRVSPDGIISEWGGKLGVRVMGYEAGEQAGEQAGGQAGRQAGRQASKIFSLVG
jgi:hypothetical protein